MTDVELAERVHQFTDEDYRLLAVGEAIWLPDGTTLECSCSLPLRKKIAAEVLRLRAAIRKHRDYQGDDRCHLDDGELYAVLPEGDTRPARDTAVTLENCERYIRCRQQGLEYVSPQRRIEELEAAFKQSLDLRNAMCAALGMRVTDGQDDDPVEWCRHLAAQKEKLGKQLDRLEGVLIELIAVSEGFLINEFQYPGTLEITIERSREALRK